MSAIKYDSLFTDRVSGNKNEQGLPLIDFSRDLNKKFWMDIKDENNVSSFFFKIKQFTPEDSTKITNAITNKKDVFFDANGNITIREPNSSDNIFQWLNLLSKKQYTASDYDNIFYRKDSNEQKRKINTLPRPDFILSNNSTWILYTKDNICYILYNPLHRQSFKNYYNNTLKPTEYQDVSGKIDKLFNIYCGIQKKRNLTSNDIREYSDRSCNCIIQEDGIDDASGVKISNPQFRSEMKLAYFCYAPSCNSSSLEVSTSSFMDGTDGYRARRVKGEYGDSGCPARPVSICNIDITSAGNTNIVGSNLAQTCGFNSKTSQPAPATSPPVITPPPVTSPPFTTTTDIKVVDIINKSYFIKSYQVLFDNEYFKNNLI